MGKNGVIKQFQNARLYAWIGQNEIAEKMYNEIESSEEKLAYVLRPTIKERKETLNKYLMHQNYSAAEVVIGEMVLDSRKHEQKLLGTKNKLIPQISIPGQKDPADIRWKYGITTISKTQEFLRLEIRGFNPDGQLPKLEFDLDSVSNGWKLVNQDYEPKDKASSSVRLVWFLLHLDKPTIQLYISIDKWGLLYGTMICKSEEIDDAAGYVHYIVSLLDDKVW